MDPNHATIISGVLSMAGGAIGAMFAYKAAIKQMTDGKKRDDANRILDIKVKKLEDVIAHFNDLLLIIKTTDGYLKDLYITMDVYKDKRYTHLNHDNINVESFSKMREATSKIEIYISRLNSYRWFVTELIDFDTMYTSRTDYSEAVKKIRILFSSVENKVSLELNDSFYTKLSLSEENYDEKYKSFEGFLDETIKKLENEIKSTLSIKEN